MQVWDIREPTGASLGLEFARAGLDAHDVVLAHALPDVIDVEVRDDSGAVVARAAGLQRTAHTRMARLTISNGAVRREDLWPQESDIGRAVILPGGEAGILTAWWNAADESEWRWSVEFYNHT